MASVVKPIPEGYHTITPHLIIQGADRAIAFYREAFGAEEVSRMSGPDGRAVMHAELRIGDSRLFLCDEFPDMGYLGPKGLGGTPATIHLYVEDADAIFDRAVKAGAEPTMPLSDAFWGDRYGKLTDPFGHRWSVATRIEEVSPEECDRRMAEWAARSEPSEV